MTDDSLVARAGSFRRRRLPFDAVRRPVAIVFGLVAVVLTFVLAGNVQLGGGAPAAGAESAVATGNFSPRGIVRESTVAGALLFIGASYSIGVGATGPTYTFPALVAHRLHDRSRVDAVSGTGFQNPGVEHRGTFAQRLAHDSTAGVRLVLIQGGRNDIRFPPGREFSAVLATIRAAQSRFAQAQVVVLGPIPARLPISARLSQVRRQIARACATAHAGFIDPIAERWITRSNEHDYVGAVPGHPNDAGYRYIAGRLLAELPAALASTQPHRNLART